MLRGLLACLLALVLVPPVANAEVTIGDAQVSETNGATTATFTVTRTTGLLFGGATIHFATADGSAQAPGDYEGVAGDLFFGSAPLGGTQVQTVPVTVRGDALDEGLETFRLVLSGSAEVTDADGTATIADDDPLPVAEVSDAAPAAEGAAAVFTVSLSAPSGREVSVDFATADAGAIAGVDYTATSGTLAIPAGATTAAIGVPLADDGEDEPDEQFVLQIGSPAFATLGRASAVATIADNDEPAQSAPGPDTSAGTAGPGTAVAETAPATTAPAPRLGLSSPRLRRPSIVLVTVFCPRAASGCKGRVTIFSRRNLRSRIKALRQERRLGQRNFTLLPGASRTLTIALSRSDRVLLMRTGRMLVRAFAITSDGSGPRGVRRANGTLIGRTTHS